MTEGLIATGISSNWLVGAVDASISRCANVAPALAIDQSATIIIVVAVVLAPFVCEETERVRACRFDGDEACLEEAGQLAAGLVGA